MSAIDFSHLPISQYLAEINQSLTTEDCLVLQADPGAGKSTAVPLYLLENLDLGHKKILMLEPRRLAAKSIAEYLANLLDEKVGETVGYQVRHQRKVSANTRLEIITEGILTQRIQNDPELADIGLVIFDEFHERSIHADFGLTLCKDIRAGFNDNLKLLVMSATIDTQQLSDFLDQAPIIASEGRCYPVDSHYLPKPIDSLYSRDWLAPITTLIKKAVSHSDGDVLVFLPGQKDIQLCQQELNEFYNGQQVVVLPLFGSLKFAQQQQALAVDPQGRKKVVLATNIAETSLTIANIAAVVDSGLEKVALYDVSSGMTKLVTQRISKASAEQRLGRAGRLKAGSCYRLWTESQQQGLLAFAAEEITTSDLAGLQLNISQWGVQDYLELDWLTPPPLAHISAAQQLLQSLQLLTDNNQLTTVGSKAAEFTTDPRYASLLVALQNEQPNLKTIACDLIAVLTDSHFYLDRNDADLSKRLLALQAFRKDKKTASKQFPLKFSVAEQVLKTAQLFAKKLQLNSVHDYNLTELQQHLGTLVARIYPDRIAKQRTDSRRYQLSNGKGAVIAELDNLQPSEWLAVADLDGQRQDGRIYLATEIEQDWLEQQFGMIEEAVYRYEQPNNKIIGRLQKHLGRIVLSEKPLVEHDQLKFQQCLQQVIIDSRLQVLPWPKKTKQWLDRVNWLMAQQSQPEWPDMSQVGLINRVDSWLFPYIETVSSIADLQQLDLLALLQGLLPYEAIAEIDQQAPEFYQTPSGKKLKIDYQGQLPKVSVVLQEVFGELQSPQLAWGNTQLAFELLSPAQRPIQVTSDLANFWQNSYFEVAKEMKGRYPKHRWPDQPLLEKAGRSIKTKK